MLHKKPQVTAGLIDQSHKAIMCHCRISMHLSKLFLAFLLDCVKAQVLVPSNISISGDGSIVAMNGSLSELCPNVSSDNLVSTCSQPATSILFDGFIPALTDLTDSMWASQLLTLEKNSLDDGYTPYSIFSDFNQGGIEGRVEVVMFNCPEWGISVEAINIVTYDTPLDTILAVTTNTTTTSCDSLVTVCIEFNTTQPSVELQFFFEPSSEWIHIAEIIFYNDSSPFCPYKPEYIATTSDTTSESPEPTTLLPDPEPTTPAPETTTPAPETTTPAPETTTPAPEATRSAREFTTLAAATVYSLAPLPNQILIPRSIGFSQSDLVSQNGSSGAICPDATITDQLISMCTDPTTSVLFDGITPTLTGLDGETWASQMLTIQKDTTESASFPYQLFLDFGHVIRDGTVEISMFNCPQWGISVEEMKFITVTTVSGLSSISIVAFSSTHTSCDSLVTTCFQFNSTQPSIDLQFYFGNSNNWLHIAEVKFYNNSACKSDHASSPGSKVQPLINNCFLITPSSLELFLLQFYIVIIVIGLA